MGIETAYSVSKMEIDKRFQILSLDGGGLRGIFIASFLATIEENTGKIISEHFDLIAGTSTGGLIALALGLGFRPKEILEFYKKKGPEIFPLQSFLPRLGRNLKWFFSSKYSSSSLERVLNEYFGDKRLCDSKIRLIIPSFDSVRGDVYIYKTPHHEKLRCDYKVFMKDVAIATASAPIYFPAYISDAGVRLIDGGIWANNPAMIAITEALGYLSVAPGNIAMLSIGTTQNPITSGKIHISGGLLPWSTKIVEIMMHAQSLSAGNQAFHILGKEQYLRVNPIVHGHYPLDRMSEELEGIGNTEAREKINLILNLFLNHSAKSFIPIYQ